MQKADNTSRFDLVWEPIFELIERQAQTFTQFSMMLVPMQQLPLLDGVPTKSLDPYPTRCPYCYRALTRRGGMSVAVKFRQWIAKNVDLVSQSIIQRQAEQPVPKIVLRPDLEYGLELEAQALGISLNELMNQLGDRYLEGGLKLLKRRRKRIELP